MSKAPPYRGNDPIGELESDDLKAIRRDMERNRFSQEMWQHLYPDGDTFRRDFEQVAVAAQDWGGATYEQRFRALRILVKRFGREDAYLMTLMAAPQSKQSWMLSVRQRKDSEKSDGGKRDREREREDLAQRIGEEVYQRMAAGQPKELAVEAAKKIMPVGASAPGIDKLLNLFRQNARKRGYVDPFAASLQFPVAREPSLKLSDIPKRGRPRKK